MSMDINSILRVVDQLGGSAIEHRARSVEAFELALDGFGATILSRRSEPHAKDLGLVPNATQLEHLEIAASAARAAISDLQEGANLLAAHDPRGLRGRAAVSDALLASEQLFGDITAVRSEVRKALSRDSSIRSQWDYNANRPHFTMYSDEVSAPERHGWVSAHSFDLVPEQSGRFRKRWETAAFKNEFPGLPDDLRRVSALDEPHRASFAAASEAAAAFVDAARVKRAAIVDGASSDRAPAAAIDQLLVAAIKREARAADALSRTAATITASGHWSMPSYAFAPEFHAHLASARSATTAALEDLDAVVALLDRSAEPSVAARATIDRARSTIALRQADVGRLDKLFLASEDPAKYPSSYDTEQVLSRARRHAVEYRPSGDRTLDTERLSRLLELDEPLKVPFAERQAARDSVLARAEAMRASIDDVVDLHGPMLGAEEHARWAHIHHADSYASLVNAVESFRIETRRGGITTVTANDSQLRMVGEALGGAQAALHDIRAARALVVSSGEEAPIALAELANAEAALNRLFSNIDDLDTVLQRTLGTGQTTFEHRYSGGVKYHDLRLDTLSEGRTSITVADEATRPGARLLQLSSLDGETNHARAIGTGVGDHIETSAREARLALSPAPAPALTASPEVTTAAATPPPFTFVNRGRRVASD